MSEHRIGKYTGYDIDGDRISPAPVHVDAMERLREQEVGIRTLLDAVNSYAQRSFAELERQRHEWWVRLSEDLGIDFIVRTARYDYRERVILLTLDADADAAEPPKDEATP